MTKKSEWLDIRDFGAKCDGVTDDSPALVAAVNRAAETGQTVYVPTGTTQRAGIDLGDVKITGNPEEDDSGQ